MTDKSKAFKGRIGQDVIDAYRATMIVAGKSSLDRVNKFASRLRVVSVLTQFTPADSVADPPTQSQVTVSLVAGIGRVVFGLGEGATVEEAADRLMLDLVEALEL